MALFSVPLTTNSEKLLDLSVLTFLTLISKILSFPISFSVSKFFKFDDILNDTYNVIIDVIIFIFNSIDNFIYIVRHNKTMSYNRKSVKMVEAGKKAARTRKRREAARKAWHTMRTFDAKIRKSGNALVVTIPSMTVERFGIKNGDLVEVTIKK